MGGCEKDTGANLMELPLAKLSTIWASKQTTIAMYYNSSDKIESHENMNFEKVQDNYIVSKYLPTKYLFITKEKKIIV